MSRNSGHEALGPAYFIKGINDNRSIFPPESQDSFSILRVTNECFYFPSIGGWGVLRGEIPPPLEDVLFCCEDTLASRVVEGGAEITLSENLSRLSIAVSGGVDRGDHRERNSRDRRMKLVVTL